MGILDDIKMGFGLKERTADYDARTARTIAANKASADVRSRGGGDHAAMRARIRARQSYDPSNPTGQSEYYLNRAGGTGYRPAIAEDNRPFMQRILTSPTGAASPTPYAIGPMQLDQPLPAFGLLGLFTNGLSGIFGPNDDTAGSINVAKNAMSQLSPRYETVTAKPSGQPETVFEEDLSNVDLATFPISMDFSEVEPLEPAARELQEVQRIANEAEAAINSAPIIQLKKGPHAGKLFDTRTGRILN